MPAPATTLRTESPEAAKPADGARLDSNASNSSKLNLLDIAGGVMPAEPKGNRLASTPAAIVLDNPFAPPVLPDAAVGDSKKPEDLPSTPSTPPAKAGDRVIEKSPPEAKLENTSEKDFPAGSIERLDARLTEMLAERNRHLDTFQAQQQLARLAELRQRGVSEILLACQKNKIEVSQADLENPEQMRKLLAGNADLLRKYEPVFDNLSKSAALAKSLDDELQVRRDLSTKIVNEELKSLFPNGSIPAIVLEKQPADLPEDGSIRLGGRRLEVKDRFWNSSVDGAIDLTGVLVHELKHAEQSGLLIRKFIDDVVPEGSNPKLLTDEQKAKISQAFKDTQGNSLRPDVLDEIFAQRAGARLSPSQTTRAERLVQSFQSSKGTPVDESLLSHIGALNKELQVLRLSPMTAAPVLDAKEGDYAELRKLFDGRIPPAIQEEIARVEKLGGSHNMTYQDSLQFYRVYTDELLKQLASDQAKEQQIYQKYKNSAHEVEAFAAGAQAEERIATVNRQAQNEPQSVHPSPDEPIRIADSSFPAKTMETRPDGTATLSDQNARRLQNDPRFSREERKILDEPGVREEIATRLARFGRGAIPLALLTTVALQVLLSRRWKNDRYELPTN